MNALPSYNLDEINMSAAIAHLAEHLIIGTAETVSDYKMHIV